MPRNPNGRKVSLVAWKNHRVLLKRRPAAGWLASPTFASCPPHLHRAPVPPPDSYNLTSSNRETGNTFFFSWHVRPWFDTRTRERRVYICLKMDTEGGQRCIYLEESVMSSNCEDSTSAALLYRGQLLSNVGRQLYNLKAFINSWKEKSQRRKALVVLDRRAAQKSVLENLILF